MRVEGLGFGCLVSTVLCFYMRLACPFTTFGKHQLCRNKRGFSRHLQLNIPILKHDDVQESISQQITGDAKRHKRIPSDAST